jgi:hypothetical protein
MCCRGRGILFWASLIIVVYIISISPSSVAKIVERGYHSVQNFFDALHQFITVLL